jgi:tetratricopeptide (TPR) repeat protein
MAITLPFAMLVLDYWPLHRIAGWIEPSPSFPIPQSRFSRLILEKFPLLALSIASGAVTFLAQRGVGAVARAVGWPLSWRVGNAIHSYGMYLYQVLLPHGLAPFYPATSLHILQVIWAAALIAAISWFVWRLRTTHPYLVVGWLWFVGTLVPVIGVVQVGSQAMADRYTYIPMLGLLVAVVWGARDLLHATRSRPVWYFAASGLAVALLSISTWRQVRYWDNSFDLWTHALQVTRSNFVAEENLAVSLLDLGREDEAFLHFERVVALKPDDVVAWLNLGNHLEKQGHHDKAIEAFKRTIEQTRETDKLMGAYRGLGVAYAQQGDLAGARANFLHALQLNPNSETEVYNLSLLEVLAGIDQLSNTLSAHPTSQGYWQLGQLLQADRRIEEARVAYQKALHLNPKMKEAEQSLRSLSQD